MPLTQYVIKQELTSEALGLIEKEKKPGHWILIPDDCKINDDVHVPMINLYFTREPFGDEGEVSSSSPTTKVCYVYHSENGWIPANDDTILSLYKNNKIKLEITDTDIEKLINSLAKQNLSKENRLGEELTVTKETPFYFTYEPVSKLLNHMDTYSTWRSIGFVNKLSVKDLYEDEKSHEAAKYCYNNAIKTFNTIESKYYISDDKLILLQFMSRVLEFRLAYEKDKADKKDKVSKEKADKITAIENKLFDDINNDSPNFGKISNNFIGHIDSMLSGLKKSKPKEAFTILLSKLYEDCLEHRNKYDAQSDINKTSLYSLMSTKAVARRDDKSISETYEDKSNHASAKSSYENALTALNEVKSKYDNTIDTCSILQLMNSTLEFRCAYEIAKASKKDKISKVKADNITSLESKLVGLVNANSPNVKKIFDDFIQYVTLEELRLKSAKPKESFTLLFSKLKNDCVKISDEYAKLAKKKNVKPSTVSSSSTFFSESSTTTTKSVDKSSRLEVKLRKK